MKEVKLTLTPRVTGATIGLARSIFLIAGIAAALYVLQPVLLALAVIGFIPMWLASLASSRQMYRWWRSMVCMRDWQLCSLWIDDCLLQRAL